MTQIEDKQTKKQKKHNTENLYDDQHRPNFVYREWIHVFQILLDNLVYQQFNQLLQEDIILIRINIRVNWSGNHEQTNQRHR